MPVLKVAFLDLHDSILLVHMSSLQNNHLTVPAKI